MTVIFQVLSRTEAVFLGKNMARSLEDGRFKPNKSRSISHSTEAATRKVPWRAAVSTG